MKNSINFVRHGDAEVIHGRGQVDLPAHSHRCYTLISITEGSLELELNHKTSEVSEGTVIILPSNCEIAFRHITDFAYTSWCFHDQTAELLNAFCSIPFIVHGRKDYFDTVKDILADAGADTVKSVIAALIDSDGTVLRKECPNVVRKACAYMDANIQSEDFSIEKMASDLGVSKGYLARAFKKEMNITPVQYMLQNRLRTAKRALEHSHDGTFIAYDSGFSAQSHLCYVFRKYMGISISEYRKSIAGDLKKNTERKCN